MSFVLNLGVIDQFYSNPGAPPKKGQKKASKPVTTSTGDVAGYLERKYHILQIYYESNSETIRSAIVDAFKTHFENSLLGAPTSLDMFGDLTADLQRGMKHFVASGQMERLGYPGVPTQAALDGVNHRLGIKKGLRRISFSDTGLYEASLIAWVDKT